MEGLGTPQNKMYTLYNRCTLFISAGQSEGFNMPCLEAMACGCPVVCTPDGGNADFVKHGYNAIVVNRTIGGIQDGVRLLINDKELRNKLRKNGLETAKHSKFNWDNITKKLEGVLLGLLK